MYASIIRNGIEKYGANVPLSAKIAAFSWTTVFWPFSASIVTLALKAGLCFLRTCYIFCSFRQQRLPSDLDWNSHLATCAKFQVHLRPERRGNPQHWDHVRLGGRSQCHILATKGCFVRLCLSFSLFVFLLACSTPEPPQDISATTAAWAPAGPENPPTETPAPTPTRIPFADPMPNRAIVAIPSPTPAPVTA